LDTALCIPFGLGSTGITAAVGDRLTVQADGKTVRFYKNSTLVYSMAQVSPTEILHGGFCAFKGSATFSGITFSAGGNAGADGANAKGITLTATSAFFPYDAAGNPITQTVTFKATRQNTTVQTQWTIRDRAGSSFTGNAAALAAMYPTAFTRVDDDTLTMTHTQFVAWIAGGAVRETTTVEATVTDGDSAHLPAFGLVDEIVVVDAADGAIGRDDDGIEAVYLVELFGGSRRSAGHAGELVVEAEVILECDRGKGA
jgi:hypothetical protein